MLGESKPFRDFEVEDLVHFFQATSPVYNLWPRTWITLKVLTTLTYFVDIFWPFMIFYGFLCWTFLVETKAEMRGDRKEMEKLARQAPTLPPIIAPEIGWFRDCSCLEGPQKRGRWARHCPAKKKQNFGKTESWRLLSLRKPINCQFLKCWWRSHSDGPLPHVSSST